MLQSDDKHQWSADGLVWFDVPLHGGNNGGSEAGWPRGDKGRDGDERYHLSFWGAESSDLSGGCCSSSTAVLQTHPSLPGNRHTVWGQSFILSYLIDLQPLPPNTGMSLVTNVAGTTLANDAFWAVECLKISSVANGIVVDMGAVSVAVRANILPLLLPL